MPTKVKQPKLTTDEKRTPHPSVLKFVKPIIITEIHSDNIESQDINPLKHI